MKNFKTFVFYDASHLLSKLRMPMPAGIARTEIEYLKTLVNFYTFNNVVGVVEVYDKNKINYLVKLDSILFKNLVNLLFNKWIKNGIEEDEFSLESKILFDKISNSISNLSVSRNKKVCGGLNELISLGFRNLYLNFSYITIRDGSKHAELIKKLELESIYLIYDLIPIEFPEYMWNNNIFENHLKILLGIIENNAQMIAISYSVKKQIEDVLNSLGLNSLPIAVIECGVSDNFIKNKIINFDEKLIENEISIVCTIEPRKNHAIILNAYRMLLVREVSNLPKLNIIGRRGWANEDTFRMLDNSPALKANISEYNNLNDGDVIKLIKKSKATFFPSFAEGWGLPIVESLSLGVPVVCSDIDVHLECSQGLAKFISPIDGEKWASEIIKISQEKINESHVKYKETQKFSPITWNDSSVKIIEFINI